VIGSLRRAFLSFFAHQGFFLAAGLSFYFLICIIPVLFLVVSVIGFVLSREAAAAAVVAELTRNFPVYRVEINRALMRTVAARALSGVLGTVILILFSTQLFSSMRLVLARLYGSRQRGFLPGVLFDAVLVVSLAPLFVLSMVASGLFTWFREFVMKPAHLPGPWFVYSSVVFSLVVSTVMYYLVYRNLATRRASRGAALAGAVLTSVLWEIAKELFGLYIREFDVYDQIYGPLGVLVAFMMFVYYTMVVFVLGAAFVAALDSRG
jgi:membrane protein